MVAFCSSAKKVLPFLKVHGNLDAVFSLHLKQSGVGFSSNSTDENKKGLFNDDGFDLKNQVQFFKERKFKVR